MTDRTTPTTAELDARQKQSATGQAEADARKAAADAEAARWGAAKAEAEARGAVADARKAEIEADDTLPKTAQERAAVSAKTVAEADRDAAAARRDRLEALIPDFSKVTASTLELREGTPGHAMQLTFGALSAIGSAIGSRVMAPARGDAPTRILVTSDEDLATPDARSREVVTGLEQLDAAAAKLIDETKPQVEAEFAIAPELIAALASAVPSVLSLFSGQRTLTAGSVTIGDLPAIAAVAGALVADASHPVVIHDDFRLVQAAHVYAATSDLSTRRQLLVGRKIELTDRKAKAEADLVIATAELKDAEKAVADAGDNATDNQRAAVGRSRTNQRTLSEAVGNDAVRLGLIDGLTQSIDQFILAIGTAPAGGSSPLAIAAIHEQLHEGAEARFSHVLLVKTQGGQSRELIENRPWFLADKFSTVVDVTVSYMLIETTDSAIVSSGSVTATGRAWGKLGQEPVTSVGPTT